MIKIRRSREYKALLAIILSGLLLGGFGVMLSVWGNPKNTGICVSCFLENIAGALGLHNNVRMMYIRPEIIGFVLGSFLTAGLTKEFRSRGGNSPLIYFLIGIFLIVGSSVFIGCPLKLMLRLSAGDINALVGFGGLVSGILIGVLFMKEGFFPGKPRENKPLNTVIFIGGTVLLLIFLVVRPDFIRFSVKGAAARSAPLLVSLFAGLVIGSAAQRSRFCVTGAWRNFFLAGDRTLLYGLLTLFLAALALNVSNGDFSLNRFGQPGSHPDILWNFLSMALVGLGSVMVGGCPFRQLVLAGEGDGDAVVCVLGMLMGAALVQNFEIRSLLSGPTVYGKVSVILGFFILIGVGRYLLEEEADA